MGESSARLAVVIEDDADVRHLLRTILVRSGFEVILTKDGAEGVEAVRAHDPELTTLDVNMPGMDGFAAAKLIREFSSTYIIMLTGLDDEIDVVQGLDSGADDYLVKPFRPRELRARIESVMRRPRQHVTTTAAAAATDRTSPAQPQQWAQPAAEPTRSDAEQQHLPQREVAPPPSTWQPSTPPRAQQLRPTLLTRPRTRCTRCRRRRPPRVAGPPRVTWASPTPPP